MSIMGIGTATLGYSNKFIDTKVISAIKKGVNTTLNSLDEYNFAKKILQRDSFADQVKFAKSGGEAMSMAIRIARARNGKSRIAFSGYHGWQDWYIAANLKNKKFKQPSFKRFSSTWNPERDKGHCNTFYF